MRKKPVLLKHILGERKEGGKTTIGLIGTHSGVGVTHTAILIANSLRMIGKSNIAYVEMSGKNHIKYLQKKSFMEDTVEQLDNSLVIGKINYYMSVSEKELISILNEPFHYFILDFGSDYKNNRNEFLRCNIKLAVGSFTEWKRVELENFIEKNKDLTGYDKWQYLMVFGCKNQVEMAKRQFHSSFKSIGFEPNPFVPTKEFLNLSECILC